MASTISLFDPTSPFVTYATQATRGVIIGLLQITAMNCNTTPNETFRIYFDGSRLAEKIIKFKELLNVYIHTCCNEYLNIHQQIVDKRLQKSDLNEDNMEHYVYCTIQKIISDNDVYEYLNYIFDSVMKYGIIQFEYVFQSITRDGVTIAGTTSSRGGNFSVAEIKVIRNIIELYLNKANEQFHNLSINDNENKYYHLKYDENDSCQLNIEDTKQQRDIIKQEKQSNRCCLIM